jgi:hypothetical protein
MFIEKIIVFPLQFNDIDSTFNTKYRQYIKETYAQQKDLEQKNTRNSYQFWKSAVRRKNKESKS